MWAVACVGPKRAEVLALHPLSSPGWGLSLFASVRMGLCFARWGPDFVGVKWCHFRHVFGYLWQCETCWLGCPRTGGAELQQQRVLVAALRPVPPGSGMGVIPQGAGAGTQRSALGMRRSWSNTEGDCKAKKGKEDRGWGAGGSREEGQFGAALESGGGGVRMDGVGRIGQRKRGRASRQWRVKGAREKREGREMGQGGQARVSRASALCGLRYLPWWLDGETCSL